MAAPYNYRTKSIRSGITKSSRKAVLLLIVCFFVACDDGRPSSDVLRSAKDLHKYLARQGDPNGITKKDFYKSHYTLLHRAAIYSDEEIVSALLSAGADPNRGDNTGQTPLMAVFTTREHDPSRLGVLQRLLKVSDLSIKDAAGKTANDYAKEFGSTPEIALVEEALISRSHKSENEQR